MQKIRTNTQLNRRSMNARLLRIYRRGLINRMTLAELAFEQILKQCHCNYMPQAGFFTDHSFYIADFYVKRPHKLVIEINGDDHKQSTRACRDMHKISFLRNRGYRVLLFSNATVLKYPRCVERILRKYLARSRFA